MNLKQQTIAQITAWMVCGIIGGFLGNVAVGLWIGVMFAFLIVLGNAAYKGIV